LPGSAAWNPARRSPPVRRDLLLVGAGGFAREAVEVVRAVNERRPTWRLLGFLDDDAALHGTEIDGVPVLGSLTQIQRYPEALLAICIGNPGNYFSRKRVVRRLGLPPSRYATLIHPSAVVPPAATIGPGSILLALVVATTAVHVGAHVVMMPAVVLTHDDIVGDFVTFGAGVRLAGRVHVGEGAYIGAGVNVREDCSIGAWSLVGMGSLVTRSIPAGEVWYGTPARFRRAVEVPSDVEEEATW
jgi:sugar O-acyltransferase (sialic acid O-acetyltransferase NeuD family)